MPVTGLGDYDSSDPAPDSEPWYSRLFGHLGKPAGLPPVGPEAFGGSTAPSTPSFPGGLPPVGSEAFGGTTPSVLPSRGLITSNNPTSPYFSGNTQNPGNPFQGPGGQNIPPQPTPGMTLTSTPQSPAAAPTLTAPLPAPGAQRRPTSTGAMPPRTAAPSSGGGGNASGNRIPPQSVNLGYGAPGVGHYVPTTGIGRGPGTYVPGDMTMIESPNGSGRMMAVPSFNLFGGGGGQAQPAAAPTEHLANYIPDGKGGMMPAPWAAGASQPAVKPLGALAQGGTVNLPTSYRLPGGSRLTPQGDVISP